MATRFQAHKQKILEQLAVPEGKYQDLSPKGSIDVPIRDLIGEINSLEGLVTTSSCSGRVSVFLEGRKTDIDAVNPNPESEELRAGPGGKGGDSNQEFMTKFGLSSAVSETTTTPGVSSRYVHLKFEPMILHILSASLEHAQRILTAALSAGFRESGAVSLGTSKGKELNPMVAVRSTGYSFDSIIGYQDEGGHNCSLVDEAYLQTLVGIANERFKVNNERIARFRKALLDSYYPQDSKSGGSVKPEWEDAETRKRRKREEGLARQQALRGLDHQPNVASIDRNAVDNVATILR